MTGHIVDHVHLVFKTHLDLGFTDFAHAVLQRYLTDFIPHALNLARRLRQTESTTRFVWTTGSWLIDAYLEQSTSSARREMEAAILAGDITWHALPFTTHTELMDADLFRFGLSLSQQLDARFGRKTIAAKMTDVPGHTRAVVSLLAEAGVEFLHIGVNEASPLPDVPPIFVWLDEASGERVIVMYHGSYGEETTIPALRTALVIAFTGDNVGPPDESSVAQRYQQIQSRFPGAQISASTLDSFALELRAIRSDLPVVTAEIGDTWIHGVGSDPTKVRQFLELCRLRQRWIRDDRLRLSDPVQQEFSKNLLCVPEHTWGLDSKTHLRNFRDYEASAFAKSRNLPAFQMMNASWEEQRRYLDQAVAALAGTPMHADALAVLQENPAPEIDGGAQVVANGRVFVTPLYEIAFDPQTGAICHLRSLEDDRLWATKASPLGLFRYETFSQADYDTFWAQFIRNASHEDVRTWAPYDYTKPGIAGKAQTNRLIPSQMTELRRAQAPQFTLFMVSLETRPDLTTRYGAPKHVQLHVTCHHDQRCVSVKLSWPTKPACRLPEAAWLSFIPVQTADATWRIEKLGSWIDPLDVVNRGNRSLHAAGNRVCYRDAQSNFTLITYDAPLVAPGEPVLLRFTDRLPNLRGGVHINLLNNVWGTNFPQWIEGAATFRFDLDFSG